MKTIADARLLRYDFSVPATAGAGVDSPMDIGAAAPFFETGAFFAPATLNGGRCWEAEKLAGPYSRSVNPILSATLCLTAGVADSLSNRSLL
jgi:hypothetical protein